MDTVLLVASPGGHIDELFDFVPRLVRPELDRIWVTAETPQTKGLLRGEEVRWVPPVASRQAGRAVASLPRAFSIVRSARPAMLISTGAALATPYLVAASAHRIPSHYIESATRLDGPSLTGKIAARLPAMSLHHQGFRTEVPGWHALGSVFDCYSPGPTTTERVRRAVVILGTERYPFTRALELVVDAFPDDVEVLVQVGHTPTTRSVRGCRQWVPGDELLEAVRRADVVITHAGVGSVLSALRSGKHPVVIPRRAALGEHVDDHQLELAGLLEARGLASVAWEGDDLAELVDRAAGLTTVRDTPPGVSTF